MNKMEKIKEYCKKRNGKVLDADFVNNQTLMTFVDSKGRIFQNTWARMSNNKSWSPYEALEKKQTIGIKYSLKDLQEFAESKGGKLISQYYSGPNELYEWEDSQGKRFNKTWKYVRKSWGEDRRGKHFALWTKEQVVSWCKEKGGEFLSEDYTQMEKIYQFRDRNGVEFSQSFRTCLYNNDLLYVERSRGEAEISDFLLSLGVPFESKAKRLLDDSNKEIDIWIPSLNIGIEYHGLYWHTTESSTTPISTKQKLAESKGITLIQIFEHEWKERKDQVKSFLLSKLGLNAIKIGARSCEVKQVPKDEAKIFFNSYHIQGYASSKVVYGLYYKDELVCAASFGLHHRDSSKTVLNRFVGKTNISVAGGLSRLCKQAFIDLGEFITWVDLRWSSGKSWISCGWRLEERLYPDYFYLDPRSNKVISKQSRKKSVVGTPAEMTEAEHAKLDGLKTIKDAGKIRLVYKV